MKKILTGMCMVAMVALAFTSCKKNEDNARLFVAGTEELTIEDDGAKVYVSGNKILFEAGDQVMMYNINNNDATNSYYGIYTAASQGTTVNFNYQSGPITNHGTKQDAFFAFYPGEIVNNAFLSNENTAVFEIPVIQTYREVNGAGVLAKGGWAMAAKDEVNTEIGETFFTFKNIMGGICFKLKSASGKTVTSIEVEDNVFNLTGNVHLKIHEVNPVTLTTLVNNYDPANDTYMASLEEYINQSGYFVDGENKGKIVKLNCEEFAQGGVTLNGSTPKPFYIALRPLALYGGFTATVSFSDATYAVVSSTRNNMVKPGVVKTFTLNIDDYIVSE